MSPAPQTPAQAAATLYAVIPHALEPSTLEAYGIEAPRAQAQQITRELLSLSLFWTGCALQATLTAKDAKWVFDELRQCVLANWKSGLGQEGHDAEHYLAEMEERRLAYDRIVQEGGAPVAVSSETAAILVHAGAVRPEDRQKLLALLVDLVPVDELGEVAQEIDLS